MRTLTLHARYACAHSGACCRTAWHVPVEREARRAIEAGMATRRLPMINAFEARVPPAGTAGVLRHGEDGACVWLEGATRLCLVHQHLGEDALPVTCRTFPRIARTGPRGIDLTLSHYCPTAARLLLVDGPLAVQEAPPAFTAPRYDGLFADEWPPLLHPRMLMDDAAYEAWETLAVARCSTAPTVWSALAALRADAGALCRWQPGAMPLLAAVEARGAVAPGRASALTPALLAERLAEVWSAVPPDIPLGAPPFEPDDAAWTLALDALDRFDAPARRLLAAHAFASWCAYQARGLHAHVRGLEAVVAVLLAELARAQAAGRGVDATAFPEMTFVEAVRATDFLLRHLAGRQALADAWSDAEGLRTTRRP